MRNIVIGLATAAAIMDDCRKRQTSTATPAEPGDLPWGLDKCGITSVAERPCLRRFVISVLCGLSPIT